MTNKREFDEHLAGNSRDKPGSIDGNPNDWQPEVDDKTVPEDEPFRTKYQDTIRYVIQLMLGQYAESYLLRSVLAWDRQTFPSLGASAITGIVNRCLVRYKYLLSPERINLNLQPNYLEWAESAWKQLLTFGKGRGIDSDRLEQVIDRDFPVVEKARDFRAVFGGYYLLAEGRAPDNVIHDLYMLLYSILIELVGCEEEKINPKGLTKEEIEWVDPDSFNFGENYLTNPPEEQAVYRKALEKVNAQIPGFTSLMMTFDDANGFRLDEALAIDAAIYHMHSYGFMVAILFEVQNAELMQLIAEILDQLAA